MLHEMSLVIDGLRKQFGPVVALDGLSFDVPRGQVFGFLGANGAGKTTTMRILLGVLRADAGTVTWDGRDSSTLARTTWGYLPEERGLYPRMTVLDQLAFFAGLYGVPRDQARRIGLEWLTRFRVPEFADRKADELSKGNQQKVQFLAAVLHDPDVLLLDEPFTGLDPVNVALLREAFLELRDRGKTIIFSTHQMEMAESLCESLAIVDRGKVVVGGALRDVKRSLGRQVVKISVSDHRLAFMAGVQGAKVIRWGVEQSEIELEPGVEPAVILRAAVESGAEVRHFEIADPSLEQIFIDHVGQASASNAESPDPESLVAA